MAQQSFKSVTTLANLHNASGDFDQICQLFCQGWHESAQESGQMPPPFSSQINTWTREILENAVEKQVRLRSAHHSANLTALLHAPPAFLVCDLFGFFGLTALESRTFLGSLRPFFCAAGGLTQQIAFEALTRARSEAVDELSRRQIKRRAATPEMGEPWKPKHARAALALWRMDARNAAKEHDTSPEQETDRGHESTPEHEVVPAHNSTLGPDLALEPRPALEHDPTLEHSSTMKLDSTLEHGSTPELSSTLKHVSTATPLQPALFPLHEMKRPSSSGGVSANHNVRQDVPRNDHVGVEEIGSVSANPNLRQEALQNDPLGTDEDGGASMLLASIAEEGEIFVLAPERLRRSTSSTPSPELARQGSRNLQDSFDTEDYTEMWPSDPQLFTSTPTARVQDITYPAIPQKRKAAESFKDKYPASTRDGSRGIPEQSAQVELPGAKDRPSSMESRIADNSEDGVLTGIQKADGIKAQNVTPLGQEQSLTLRGYRSLSPNSWLSNDAIDIGLAAFNPDPDRFHIFDTAFVKADQRSQMKVSPRVAKVLQQNQKLCALICPVNLSQSHWTLGIIEVPQRQVLIFDSLNTSPCSSEWATTIQCLAKTILDDIGDEAADTSTPWKVAKLQTNLQQRDSFSCGIYIIATATLYMHGVLDRFPELEPLVWRRVVAAAVSPQLPVAEELSASVPLPREQLLTTSGMHGSEGIHDLPHSLQGQGNQRIANQHLCDRAEKAVGHLRQLRSILTTCSNESSSRRNKQSKMRSLLTEIRDRVAELKGLDNIPEVAQIASLTSKVLSKNEGPYGGMWTSFSAQAQSLALPNMRQQVLSDIQWLDGVVNRLKAANKIPENV